MNEIDDVVRERSGQDAWRIPGPGPKWVRFNCPFCHDPSKKRKNEAAINYDAQWFMCFHCGRGFYSDDAHYYRNDERLKRVLEEHRELIRNVIISVKRKLGNWVTHSQLHTRAEELVWGYAFLPPGGPNDTGKLEDWKAYADGDDQKFNDRMASVLWADLMNYADGIASSERVGGMTHAPKSVSVVSFEDEDTGQPSYMSISPRLRTTGVNEWWLDDLEAIEDGRPKITVPIGCDRLDGGLPPIAGHCVKCNLSISYQAGLS